MSTLHNPLCYSGGVDGRMTCGYKEYTDKESCLLGTDKEVNLVFCREDCLKHEAHFIAETLLTPFSAIVGCLKYSISGVPIPEFFIGNLVGIDVYGAVSPFVMKEFLGYRSLAGPVRPGYDYLCIDVLLCFVLSP